MKSKIKTVVFLILIGLVVLAGILHFLKNTSYIIKGVKIVDYSYSVCTQDIPSSDCGPYEVTVQTADGLNNAYKVAGFSNRDSKLYDELTAKISKAKEQKSQVILKVNNKGEIISVQ